MAQKFYVVWSGRQTGVFKDWASVQKSVDKHPGARFKSFSTQAEAERAYLAGSSASAKTSFSQIEVDVRIFCDGACEPNPGNAGSGVVVYRVGRLAELWYGLYHPAGTNNTAELNALHRALHIADAEIHSGQSVEVCSDSMYSINCIRDWAPGWERRGWKKAGGEIKNLEIIQTCYKIYQRVQSKLLLTHVSAHVGTEGNELADRMAMLGVQTRVTEWILYPDEIDIAKLLKMRAG